MRAFISVEATDELKRKIAQIQSQIKDEDLSFTNKEQLHFTLRFFADLPDDRIDDAVSAMKKTVEKFEPFEIEIEGIGVFPSEKYMRVIWLGIKTGREQLIALAELLDHELATNGLGHADRRFEPHLTIARVKFGKNKERLLKILQKLKDINLGTLHIDKLRLVKSELRIGGAIHTEIASADIT